MTRQSSKRAQILLYLGTQTTAALLDFMVSCTPLQRMLLLHALFVNPQVQQPQRIRSTVQRFIKIGCTFRDGAATQEFSLGKPCNLDRQPVRHLNSRAGQQHGSSEGRGVQSQFFAS